jgi:hypothetical protein
VNNARRSILFDVEVNVIGDVDRQLADSRHEFPLPHVREDFAAAALALGAFTRHDALGR